MSVCTVSTTEFVDYDIDVEAIDIDLNDATTPTGVSKEVQTETVSIDARLINIGIAASISRTTASTLFLLASCIFRVNLDATSNLFAGGMIFFLVSHAIDFRIHFEKKTNSVKASVICMLGIAVLVITSFIGFQSKSDVDAILWVVGTLTLLMGQLMESYKVFAGEESVHYSKLISRIFAIAGTGFLVLGALLSFDGGNYYGDDAIDAPEGVADSIKAMMEKSFFGGRASMFMAGAIMYLLHSWFYLYSMLRV
eukprot:scaffold5236_cov229-Chaetoceros_neogracile.AAC.5